MRSSFYDYHGPYTYEQAEEMGRKLKTSKLVVWDLTSNPGGSDLFPRSFIQGINDYVERSWDAAILHSNYTEKCYEKEPYYYWTYKEMVHPDLSKAKYNGQIYFLMNSRTASAGEIAKIYVEYIPNYITIGENTMGGGVFGEVEQYVLPNSKLILKIASKLFNTGFTEVVGYMPDYWVDNVDLQGETIRWIKEGADYLPAL